MPLYRNLIGAYDRYLTDNQLTVGEETLPRPQASASSVAAATGVLALSFFTARKSETTTAVRIKTGGTAAAATPTLVRLGLYIVDGAGAGTLVASTANDTTLFAGTFTNYSRNWSVAYAKVAGQRYALGVLTVSGAATATFLGVQINADPNVVPRLIGSWISQTDLPSSFADASLTATTAAGIVYAAILP